MSDNVFPSLNYIQTAPVEQPALDNLIQFMIVGIMGFDPTLVRPNWQATPPNQPLPEADWCAFGIESREPEKGYPMIYHVVGVGDVQRRTKEIVVNCSWYGPNSESNAEILNDGLYVPQNVEVLGYYGIKFVAAGTMVKVPELINTQWIDRVDFPIHFRRVVERVYNVGEIASSTGQIITNSGTTVSSTVWDVTE